MGEQPNKATRDGEMEESEEPPAPLEFSKKKKRKNFNLQFDFSSIQNRKLVAEVNTQQMTNMGFLQDKETQTHELKETQGKLGAMEGKNPQEENKALIKKLKMENLQLTKNLEYLRSKEKKRYLAEGEAMQDGVDSQSQNNVLRHQVRTLQSELEEFQSKYASLAEKNELLETEIRVRGRFISGHFQELSYYKEKCVSLTRNIEILQTLNKDCRNRNEDLGEENVARSQQESHVDTQFSQTPGRIRETECQDMFLRMQNLHIAINKLSAEGLSLRKEVEHVEQQNQELLGLSHKLKHVQAVPCCKEAIDALENKNRSLTGQNRELQKRIQALEANLQKLNRIENSYNLSLNEMQLLPQQNDAFRVGPINLEKEVLENKHLKARVDLLENKVRLLQEHRDYLKNENEKLKGELEKMKHFDATMNAYCRR